MKPEVSAFMDGALDDSAGAATLKAMKQDQELRRSWATYHLLGDALRGELDADEVGGQHCLSEDFTAKVMAALADEPTVLAPPPRRESFNRISRFLLPLAASVMGVGAVAWVAQSMNSPQVTVATVAPSQTVTVAQAEPPSPRRLSEYMMAHEGYSPRGSIQGVSYYVRSVSDSRSGGAR